MRTTTFTKTEKKLLKFDVTNAPLSKFNDTVLPVLDKHTPKTKRNIYVQTIAILLLKNWEKQLWTDQNEEISS